MLIGKNVHKMILTNMSLDTPVSISFYGMLPEEFTETHSANFEEIDIKSRSSTLASYAGGSARTTEISVNLNEDYLAEFNGGGENYRLDDYVATIKSLTYPMYKGVLVLPPRLRLRIGDFFKIQGFCTSCSVTWRLPIRDGRYINAGVSLSITEARSMALSADQVIQKEDLVTI